MITFDQLVQVAAAHNLQVRTQSYDDGRVGVTVALKDDPSAVCGLACAVLSEEDLDEAAQALLPALNATLAPSDDLHEPAAGGLHAGACDTCGGAVLYAGRAAAVDHVRCPSCASDDGLVTRLEMALALSLVQSRLDDVASRAPDETSLELVPILAELAQIGAALAPTAEG
jgi:hypothetical protein